MRRTRDHDGNAIVEFVVLVALLMIPLVYLMVAVFRVQASAYGVTEAAREAGRAFISAESSTTGFARACIAAEAALQSQLADTDFTCTRDLRISCISAGCAASLQPGETVRVEVALTVALPFLPAQVFGRSAGISVHSVHDEVVDDFRRVR